MGIPHAKTFLMEQEQYEQQKEAPKKKKSVVKDIVGWIVYLALLVGLVVGTPVALSKALNSPHPMAAITSGSMWPVLKKRDLVFIRGIENKEEVEVGDVVVYQNIQGFTIHRVVRLQNSKVITKGDANNTEDTPVMYEDIIGKTVEFRGKPFRIPFLGNVSIILSKW